MTHSRLEGEKVNGACRFSQFRFQEKKLPVGGSAGSLLVGTRDVREVRQRQT